MKIGEAVSKRLIDLCNQRNLSVTKLAKDAGVTPVTVYAALNGNGDVTLSLVKKICDGMHLTVREFFESRLFDEIEKEV